MNVFQLEYAHNVAVLHGTTVTGKTVSTPTTPFTCLTLLSSYTLGNAGNTLSVAVEVFDAINNVWMSVTGLAALVLSAAGSRADSLSLPPGTTKFRLKFTCTGANTDTIEIVMGGLPQGTVIA